MIGRFGFSNIDEAAENTIRGKRNDMATLANRFVQLLADEFADYHQSFRQLSNTVIDIRDGNFKALSQYFREKEAFEQWARDFSQVLEKDPINSHELQQNMLNANPKFGLRNHLMQTAINKAENDDFSMVNDLLFVTRRPFEEHPDLNALAKPPNEQEKGIALSCSS